MAAHPRRSSVSIQLGVCLRRGTIDLSEAVTFTWCMLSNEARVAPTPKNLVNLAPPGGILANFVT